MKKIILLVLLFLSVPTFIYAAWWNPISWFQNTKSSTQNNLNQQGQAVLTSQNCSDESKIIDQLNQTISSLTDQLKNYKCPACVQNTVQCPECKPQIITQNVPVPTICPTCPVCQNQSAGISNGGSTYVAPLKVSCDVMPSPTQKGQTTTFEAIVSGGTRPYYYTWTGNKNINLPSCNGTTTNWQCSTCFGNECVKNENPGIYNRTDVGNASVTISDSSGDKGQTTTATCPDLIVQ